ncbi:condensation domain-containing protein [Streptomyces sp. NPDC048436]|uniref:condensation domain-containing protein n=1 Tax=Streptomyces sp. NPDC048436 TaxID=3365550 RepID=UPI00371569A7
MSSVRQGADTELHNSPAQRAALRGRADGNTDSAYCLTAALEIEGPADEAVIRARLHRVALRRPALRARFEDGDKHRPVDCGEPELVRVTVDGPTPADRWRGAHELARQEAHRSFPEGLMPRIRGVLFSASVDRHLLVVGVDPLVCDAWSANLVVEQLLAEEDEPGPDGYETVWRAREEWLDSTEGEQATASRRDDVAGALRHWPVARNASAPRPSVIEQVTDLDDDVVAALRDRIRQVRGTMLAVGAQALALSAATARPDVPLALTTTLAARLPKEEAVVGRLANDAVIVVPARTGTVKEHLTAIRAQIFAALLEQRTPYERIEDALDGSAAPTGVSFSLLFLPGTLSGGTQRDAYLGGARATRAAVSVCSTGADVDLFMVERPPPRGDGTRPLLRVGATARRGRVAEEDVHRILTAWTGTLARLARLDWASAPVGEAGGAPGTHGPSTHGPGPAR